MLVYLANICNIKIVACFHLFSQKWQQFLKKSWFSPQLPLVPWLILSCLFAVLRATDSVAWEWTWAKPMWLGRRCLAPLGATTCYTCYGYKYGCYGTIFQYHSYFFIGDNCYTGLVLLVNRLSDCCCTCGMIVLKVMSLAQVFHWSLSVQNCGLKRIHSFCGFNLCIMFSITFIWVLQVVKNLICRKVLGPYDVP